MADQYRINGSLYGWASIKFKIAGGSFIGITEITYGDSRERVPAYGMARHHAPIGFSPGKYSTDPVKIKGYLHTLQAIRDGLAAQSPDEISTGNTESNIHVQYTEAGLGPQNHVVERCYLAKDSVSVTESPEPGMGELEFVCCLIRRNGLTLCDLSEEQL
jgi:hypothetical protein